MMLIICVCRFGDYVDDDDVAMESSYAQQQYEEMRRSANKNVAM